MVSLSKGEMLIASVGKGEGAVSSRFIIWRCTTGFEVPLSLLTGLRYFPTPYFCPILLANALIYTRLTPRLRIQPNL